MVSFLSGLYFIAAFVPPEPDVILITPLPKSTPHSPLRTDRSLAGHDGQVIRTRLP